MTIGGGSSLLDRYVRYAQARGWSEKTIIYRIELLERLGRGQSRAPEDMDREDITRFLAGQSFGPTTRQIYYKSLRSWFAWLVDIEYRPDDPMQKIPKPKAGRRTVPTLRAEHVAHLLSTRLRRKTRTMILLGAYAGLRVSEIARVRSEDFDLIGGTQLVRGKGGVHDYLPVHPVIAAEAASYGPGWWFPRPDHLVDDYGAGPIFGESVTDVVGEAMKRAGVPGTAHSLRRWFATEMLRQGVDVMTISSLLRHASLKTTQIYLHVDERQRASGVLQLPHTFEVPTDRRTSS